MIRPLWQIEEQVWDITAKALDFPLNKEELLLSAIREQCAYYTTERDFTLSFTKLPDSAVAAFASFFTICDMEKVTYPLQELRFRNELPKSKVWKVLDLGCGAGAMSLGVLAFVKESLLTGSASFGDDVGITLDVTLIDREKRLLNIANRSVRSIGEMWQCIAGVQTRCQDLEEFERTNSSDTFDLILLGNVVNELPEALQEKLVSKVIDLLTPDGKCIVIEPALRATSRKLHEIRDNIIAKNKGYILAPCTHQSLPCPVLAKPQDWCHEAKSVVLPPRTQRLAQKSKLRTGRQKYAYLTIGRSVSTVSVPKGERRVVSDVMKHKGRYECFVCGEDGRHRLRLLKKNRSAANRSFLEIERGDLVACDTSSEVGKEESFDYVRPTVSPAKE